MGLNMLEKMGLVILCPISKFLMCGRSTFTNLTRSHLFAGRRSSFSAPRILRSPEVIGENLGLSFGRAVRMFTNNQRQEERTGKYGTPRLQYLQEIVSQFQNATDEEVKERTVANLANFAYDPYNYTFLRQLNVLELFLDCITEANEKLVEFGIGGICNACADPKNAATVVEADGIPLIIKCLSSPVRNTVNYALGALYYLCECNTATREAIMRPEVVDLIERYAAAESVSVNFSNLAKALLDKHVHTNA